MIIAVKKEKGEFFGTLSFLLLCCVSYKYSIFYRFIHVIPDIVILTPCQGDVK